MTECLYGALQVLGIFVISGSILASGYGIYILVKEAKRKP